MTTVYPIVEGHGEEAAVPVLLRRLASVVAPDQPFSCLPPHRLPRTKLRDQKSLGRAFALARSKLKSASGATFVLLLSDADSDCPVELVSQLQSTHQADFAVVPVSVVFAVREFEAWFLAANMSASHHISLRHGCSVIDIPESIADAKGTFERNVLLPGLKYRPATDQARYAACMDLDMAQRAPSFAKLVRELERQLIAT